MLHITNCQWLSFSAVGRMHTKKNLRHSKTLGTLVRYGNHIQSIVVLAWPDLTQHFHWLLCDHLLRQNVMIPNKRFVQYSVSVCFHLPVRFGEESMSRVLRWMDKAKIPENAAVLDIGTGNGAFLVELVWTAYKYILTLLWFLFQVFLKSQITKITTNHKYIATSVDYPE